MNKLLKSLFSQWKETHADTPETEKFYKKFCEAPLAERASIEDAFFLAVYDESEEAFSAGFYTAVKLLMGDGQM